MKTRVILFAVILAAIAGVMTVDIATMVTYAASGGDIIDVGRKRKADIVHADIMI